MRREFWLLVIAAIIVVFAIFRVAHAFAEDSKPYAEGVRIGDATLAVPSCGPDKIVALEKERHALVCLDDPAQITGRQTKTISQMNSAISVLQQQRNAAMDQIVSLQTELMALQPKGPPMPPTR